MARGWWRVPVAAAALAVAVAKGGVSWDEHATRDGVLWTAHATGPEEYALGSEREGVPAIPPDTVGAVCIPAPFKTGYVTLVGERALAGMEGITEVIIPEGVREIGAEAFAGCRALERVSLPESLLQIHDRAFAGCVSLRAVDLPGSILLMDEEVFAGCTALEEVRIRPAIPDIVEQWQQAYWYRPPADSKLPLIVSRRAFADCTALRKVAIEREIDWLEKGAIRKGLVSRHEKPGHIHVLDVFAGCGKIREARLMAFQPRERRVAADVFPDAFGEIRRGGLSEGSTALPEGFFRGCAQLEAVELPDSVTVVGAGVFEGCGRLKTVRWPEGLREVDPDALRGSSIEEGPEAAGKRDGEAAE